MKSDEEKKFVELRFSGGTYQRAVATISEVESLRTLIDNESDSSMLTWETGSYEIWFKPDCLIKFEIDKHEPKVWKNRSERNRSSRYHSDDRNDRNRNDRNRNDRRPQRREFSRGR